MRELKYRAWHKEHKQMYWFDLMWGNLYGSGSGYIGMCPFGIPRKYINITSDNREEISPQDCEIMQYTGLKDKHGKEVYEGDILQVDYSKRVVEVAWRKGTWVAKYEDEYLCPLMGVPGFAGYDSTEIEIIGNVYETPEFLYV